MHEFKTLKYDFINLYYRSIVINIKVYNLNSNYRFPVRPPNCFSADIVSGHSLKLKKLYV
jgi:hypothetical protein